MNILRFIISYWGQTVFFLIILFLFILFIVDFRINSRKFWLLLGGFIGFGGLVIFQRWRRKKLLAEIEEREKAIERLREKLEKLRQEHRMSREAYENALAELEQAKLEAAKSVMAADSTLARKLQEIESRYQNLSVEESIRRIREALQN